MRDTGRRGSGCGSLRGPQLLLDAGSSSHSLPVNSPDADYGRLIPDMCACKNKLVVIDGGFGTQLCAYVGEVVDGNPLWSAKFLATDPDAIIQTHLDFLRAGANAIMTNTYQASVDGFMTHLGLSEQDSFQLIKTAVDLAKEACSKFMEECGPNEDLQRPLIVGSVGPYGASLHDYSEYTGNYVENVSKQHMADWHRPRIQALLEAGVDLLGLETIPAQAEGEALVELLKEFPQHKAWLSFSCKDEQHTSHGEKFQDAARCCWERNPSQLVAVGVNCINPKFVTPLIKGINKGSSSNIPLVVYPNSGENFDPERGWVGGDCCEPVKTYVHEWLNLGVTYVGGCCRTYAKDVSQIRSEVMKWNLGRKINGHA